MKKIKLLFCLFFSFIFLFGCERTENPLSVTFCNKTMSGSGRNVVVMSVANDKLYKEKKLDVLVKSDEDVTLSICEELEDPVSVELKQDQWYSIALLLNNNSNSEIFENYKEVYSRTYIIETERENKLYFQAVVGEKNDNQGNDEELLNPINCSKVFELETVGNKKDWISLWKFE